MSRLNSEQARMAGYVKRRRASRQRHARSRSPPPRSGDSAAAEAYEAKVQAYIAEQEKVLRNHVSWSRFGFALMSLHSFAEQPGCEDEIGVFTETHIVEHSETDEAHCRMGYTAYTVPVALYPDGSMSIGWVVLFAKGVSPSNQPAAQEMVDVNQELAADSAAEMLKNGEKVVYVEY